MLILFAGAGFRLSGITFCTFIIMQLYNKINSERHVAFSKIPDLRQSLIILSSI